MTQLPFDTTPPWQRALRGGAVVLSILLHIGLAAGGKRWAEQHKGAEKADTWVPMDVVETPPEEPPPPPPPPPPPVEKPKPVTRPVPVEEPVKFEDTVTDAPPEQAPPTRKKVRKVQGLSSESFAKGSGSGLDARAGTGVGMKAGEETLSIEEAAQSVAFAAATVAPRCRAPAAELSEEDFEIIKAEKVEGRVRVVFDVGSDGVVSNVQVSGSLHPVADAACVKGWTGHTCKPGMQGDAPVTVTGMSFSCRFRDLN